MVNMRIDTLQIDFTSSLLYINQSGATFFSLSAGLSKV